MSKEQVKFEVKTFFDDANRLTKGIFIDDKHFDWGINEEDYKDAAESAKKMEPAIGRAYLKSISDSIQLHFIESLSEFMGRRVTPLEVNAATKTGFIDR